MVEWYHWVAFLTFLAAVLFVDLGLLHRDAHRVALREALSWTAAWIGLAALFGVVLWAWRGGSVAGQFAAGYLIEWSLSVDNVFVFVLVFAHFAVPEAYQHRVLFWGVLGAVALRLTFILGGAALLHRFEWIVYVFGGLLIVTAVRFLREREREKGFEEGLVLRAVRRVVPLTEGYEGQRLMVRRAGRLMGTPLLAVLAIVEASDVVFAIDSIPAVFSVTTDAFVVFASNALAILGLRSLYFVLAGAVGKFRYLKPSLAVLLAFVGVKMLLSDVVHLPIGVSLGVIVGILGVGVAASMLRPARAEA
jgi:tellurite resistance protein TerC